MKPGSQNDYQQRIDHVLAHVQQAIESGAEPPDLHTLAALSHFSPYHFHRIYRALTGESLGRSVSRLRLSRALHLLGDPARSVTEVAMQAGFGSSQALARVLRDWLGQTASGLRADGSARLAALARLRQPAGTAVDAAVALQVSVVSLEPFEVIALRTLGQYDTLDTVYTELFGVAAERGAVERIEALYGIAWDDLREVPRAALAFTSAIAVAGLDPPPPMQRQTWPGGRHACLRHTGSFLGLEDSTDQLLAGWLPGSGEQLREAPVLYRYLDDPEQVPEALLRTDILVPLA
ncbi:AraC family transcriptional regulator [Pseudoxanthomonas composti]|uniref:AraC family transcriptional regulator n=1 Tax=Pseudoxanthomonas composti TaxID=2137479 RepID=A0A4Q1JU63_9GAMM|nr:AraC family transcriptional regulator [Pseudoxanthomonas composti]RXR04292.1 AraC family transcriptional regulator [Pseudoxanthomonas composti]